VPQKHARNPLIHQDAPVLRIVAELDNVAVAVRAFEKVRLRPTAHLPHQSAGINGHSWSNLEVI
jgi:hypothetical protein